MNNDTKLFLETVEDTSTDDVSKRRIAFITLPDYNTPTQGHFTNLNGYWTPPLCVISFSANACVVPYVTEEQYELDKKEVEESYMGMISQFYSDNAF